MALEMSSMAEQEMKASALSPSAVDFNSEKTVEKKRSNSKDSQIREADSLRRALMVWLRSHPAKPGKSYTIHIRHNNTLCTSNSKSSHRERESGKEGKAVTSAVTDQETTTKNRIIAVQICYDPDGLLALEAKNQQLEKSKQMAKLIATEMRAQKSCGCFSCVIL